MKPGKSPIELTVPRGTLRKSPTGIQGLDEITGGGFPAGRSTLVSGNAGCGKTLLAMQFLVRGATDFGEPGVFISFEETADELAENFRSLGFNLPKLVEEKKLAIDGIAIDMSEFSESGEYDLEGLFIRIDSAVRSIGAKRLVLDTVEALFDGVPNERIFRGELRRLFRWLKGYGGGGLTAVVTSACRVAEASSLGLEEYIADCVVSLDQRIIDQIGTRRLQVLKYRGSAHGTNEYPFLIGGTGISVLPITSVLLVNKASRERISTGIAKLDEMLGGEGYYRGSCVLISGSPGTGKTSMSASFIDAACRRGERCLFFSYEESPDQIQRNMESIGIDLGRWVREGLLDIHAVRSTRYGLEQHLMSLREQIHQVGPSVVAIDPLTSFSLSTDRWETKPFLTRLIDYFKNQQITVLFTCLVPGGSNVENSQLAISSLMDAWVLLRNFETQRATTRLISVFKARGLSPSNLSHEFKFGSHGIEIGEPFKREGKEGA